MKNCEITDRDVVEAMIQLRDGNGTAVTTLLQRMPAHYLAEAMIQELEDRGRVFDYSFLTGLDSVLWRTVRFQNANSTMS
ncbi:MAG: hypothetical protein HQL89_17120 [Magnetococcales bacterium]|nr:hypothetical protein [Magnetococcales bacterium]